MKDAKFVVKRPNHDTPADDQVIAAVKALFAGKANSGQQQLALKWLLIDVCEIPADQFYSGIDGDRLTAYALGKRYPALQMARIRDMKIVHKESGATFGGIPVAKEPEDE